MRCLKQIVKATIYDQNDEVISVGYNDITKEEVTECPRKGMVSGEGYHLCKEVCGQEAHAEIVALRNAGSRDLNNCYLKLEGHSYACEPCKQALRLRGINTIMIEEI